MTNNETIRTNDPSSPNPSAVTLRAAGSGPSRGSKVLFIAASALGVAAMPGVADQLLSTVGSALVSTAQAAPNECGGAIDPGYEDDVIAFLKKQGVELPKEIESFVSLFELSEGYDATIVREREISILVTGEGKVLPAPKGFYVFPDGLIAEILEGGRIGGLWGQEFSEGGSFWAMCRTDGGWVTCT